MDDFFQMLTSGSNFKRKKKPSSSSSTTSSTAPPPKVKASSFFGNLPTQSSQPSTHLGSTKAVPLNATEKRKSNKNKKLDVVNERNKRNRSESDVSWDGDGISLLGSSASLSSLSTPVITNDEADTTNSKHSAKLLQQIHYEQIQAFRNRLGIKISSSSHLPPDPIPTFDALPLPHSNATSTQTTRNLQIMKTCILRNIESGVLNWYEPTAIQMQTLPVLLNFRDLIACAPTGSGKSGGFIIPALILSCMDDSDSNSKTNTTKAETKKCTIKTLLLAPSRELASQLHRQVKLLGDGKPGGLSAILLSSSNSGVTARGEIGGKRGVDVLVSTPMRLVDCLQRSEREFGGCFGLKDCRVCVLDEADRLLDGGGNDGKKEKKGSNDSDDEDDDEEEEEETDEIAKGSKHQAVPTSFLKQLDAILTALPPTCIRSLFSATMSDTIVNLSHKILRNPVSVSIGRNGSNGGGANTDITQELKFVGREEGKLLALRSMIGKGELTPPTLIFTQSKDRAQALFNELLYYNVNVDCIHSGRSQTMRDTAITRFRTGETWVLIATDVISRGLDFKAVNLVINYDFPTTTVSYVHRIGRTGRNGRTGKAITFFCENDFGALRGVANVMKQSGCEVQDWMLNMQKENHNVKKEREKYGTRRDDIDTGSKYDRKKGENKKRKIEHNKKQGGGGGKNKKSSGGTPFSK